MEKHSLGSDAKRGDQAGLRGGNPGSIPWAKAPLVGDFEIERPLGAGGMGVVYLVRNRSSGQYFAVKKMLLYDEGSRRNFLAELQTWIDLPEHPHLTACRFFRTVGNELFIFADYVDSGTLESAIQQRQLPRLDQVLDMAIQFAWGLHAAHKSGLIHQDVKPGNALLTSEGLLKVTDFGLARARSIVEGTSSRAAGKSVLVSCSGLTPAYCSPEQSEGRPLSRKTDIWSWGVSVLEMFVGEVTWMSGVAAADVLENYLETDSSDPRLPAMPKGVAEVLHKCFRVNPAERWANLAECAEVLKKVYRREQNTAYARVEPRVVRRSQQNAVIHDRRTAIGARWDDPHEWLARATRADGRDPTELEAKSHSRGGSRKAQAIADLAIYDEARRIFERLMRTGQKSLETELAALCVNAALVHWHADDMPGALALYDQAIAIRERLVHKEGRAELADALARTYVCKGNAVRALGDKRAAVALYDQAITILERLVHKEGHNNELANDLSLFYMNKAVALSQLGDNRAAVALYEQAIAILERLVHKEGCAELAHALAGTYQNKALAVSALGDKRAAVALYEQTIAILERLVHKEGCAELAHALAGTYANKANAASDLGDNRAAVALYEQAIAIRERLVHKEGRAELANDLARTYMNKAIAVRALGDNSAAVALHDQVIAIQERLVHKEGRADLADDLAGTYMNKAIAVRALGDNRAAVALYDQVIAIRERLVHKEGRADLADDLAAIYTSKANAVSALGDNSAAVALHDQAIAIRERLVHKEGRSELANELARTYQNKAVAVDDLGDKRAAVALCDQAIAIRERLVHKEGQAELAGDLVMLTLFRAEKLLALGEHKKAKVGTREAIAVLKAEIARTGRSDLQGVLNWTSEALKEIL